MDQETEKLASEVVDALYTVHRELGPGLLESVYEKCLAVELAARKLAFARQVAVPVSFRGKHIDVAFRADLIVADRLLLEL